MRRSSRIHIGSIVARNTTPPAGVFARPRDGRARDAPTRRPRARHRTTRRHATGRDGTTGERVKASEIVDASSADVDVDGATRRDANEAIERTIRVATHLTILVPPVRARGAGGGRKS